MNIVKVASPFRSLCFVKIDNDTTIEEIQHFLDVSAFNAMAEPTSENIDNRETVCLVQTKPTEQNLQNHLRGLGFTCIGDYKSSVQPNVILMLWMYKFKIEKQ